MNITTETTESNARHIFGGPYEPIRTAHVTFSTGEEIFFSRYDDEPSWIADAAFGANGFPYFSNGTGTRVTRAEVAADHVAEAIDAEFAKA